MPSRRKRRSRKKKSHEIEENNNEEYFSAEEFINEDQRNNETNINNNKFFNALGPPFPYKPNKNVEGFQTVTKSKYHKGNTARKRTTAKKNKGVTTNLVLQQRNQAAASENIENQEIVPEINVQRIELSSRKVQELFKVFNDYQPPRTFTNITNPKIPNVKFWGSILNINKLITIKQQLRSIINHDVIKYTNASYERSPWLICKILNIFMNNRFVLNKIPDMIEFDYRGVFQEHIIDANISQILVCAVFLILGYINHYLVTNHDIEYVFVFKGGRILQQYQTISKEPYSTYDADVIIMPKNIAQNTNEILLSKYNINKTKLLAENTTKLINWFLEDFEISVLEPSNSKAVNNKIYKMAYIRKNSSREIMFKPILDLGFAWKLDSNENSHVDTLQFFKDLVVENKGIREHYKSKIFELPYSFIYQSKDKFIREKEYIRNKNGQEERFIEKMRRQLEYL